MGFLNNLIKQSDFVAETKKTMPANSINLMVFADDVPFWTECNVAKLALIEVYDEESGFKKTYLIDTSIVEELDSKHFTVKNLHILTSMMGEIRFALLSDKPTNSWNRSKLEGLLASSKGKAVSFKRDSLSKVYGWSIEHDVEVTGVDMEKADEVLTETFADEFTISSMDHPVIKKLLKKDESVDVVDVDSLNSGSQTAVDADTETDITETESRNESVESHNSDLDLDINLDLDELAA